MSYVKYTFFTLDTFSTIIHSVVHSLVSSKGLLMSGSIIIDSLCVGFFPRLPFRLFFLKFRFNYKCSLFSSYKDSKHKQQKHKNLRIDAPVLCAQSHPHDRACWNPTPTTTVTSHLEEETFLLVWAVSYLCFVPYSDIDKIINV